MEEIHLFSGLVRIIKIGANWELKSNGGNRPDGQISANLNELIISMEVSNARFYTL